MNVNYTELRILESASRDAEFELKLPPLAIAAMQGDFELIQFLCEQGTYVKIRERDCAGSRGGVTLPWRREKSVEVARCRGHDEVSWFLREHRTSRSRKLMEYWDRN